MNYLRSNVFALLCSVMPLVATTSVAQAQQRATTQSAANATNAHARTPAKQTPTNDPVTLVNRAAEPEYLFGQAEVTVKGNQDPIIRLGLAQNGPSVVEFPASDNFFAVHPGSSNVVVVDESPTLATDHYLVFRAGRDFVAPAPNSRRRPSPEATVSVQMQSGMFVTFMFYPVGSVAQMAHRCVLSYSREEIVAARRAVGLAVNLDGRDPQSQNPLATSKRVAENTTQPVETSPPQIATPSTGAQKQAGGEARASVVLSGGDPTQATRNRKKRAAMDMAAEAERALHTALAAPTKFTHWSETVHGLSLAALSPAEINERQRLLVVAIKNTSSTGLRLVSGQPDLDVATLDKRGQPIQVQSITKLFAPSTAPGDAIPAGTTVYYAVVYESPVLGAAQRLRVSVAQDAAADEPAVSSLPK
ncbi:MAG: hypothetical protein M3444_00405 [Acidobacteriota bacterium]|nr:hypothetical protein [Acidobacteriota bacterium]